MKKFLVIMSVLILSTSASFAEPTYSVKDLQNMNISANSPISKSDLEKAEKIMLNVHQKTQEGVNNGKGPFYAEIYDKDGNLVVSSSNSVVEDNCALYHAEVNTLKKSSRKIQKLQSCTGRSHNLRERRTLHYVCGCNHVVGRKNYLLRCSVKRCRENYGL